jgi:hypothetical protein
MADNTQTLKDMTEDFGGPNPKYKVTQYGNSWILNSPEEGEVFLFINKKGNYQVLSADKVYRAYITDAGNASGQEALRSKLYKSKYMNKAEFDVKDSTALRRAIVEAARDISVDVVSNYVDNAIPLTQSFNSWLDKRVSMSGSSGSSSPSSGVSITTRMEANQDIDEFFVEYLGRRATEQEKTDYYNRLNTEENKAIRTRKISGDKEVATGEGLDVTDVFRIRASVLTSAVRGIPIENIINGNGKIAQDVSELKVYASDFGINLDTKQALEKVISGLKPGGSLTTGNLDAQKKSIKEMSKAFYGKLAPLIDQGVKVSDISSQFAYYKSQMLEIPDSSISIFDEDIQQALKNEGGDGVMTITDYRKLLRTNPKTKPVFLKTKSAREEAAGYANEILRSFGLMGY